MIIEHIFQKIYTDDSVRKVVDYLDKDLTIKITRAFKPKMSMRRQEFRVTVGVPNYEEKKFIKNNKKFRGLRFKFYKKS
jgi:hypothetical protein